MARNYKISQKKKQGFTITEIMVVLVIIGLIAIISIPSIQKAQKTVQAKQITNNVRVINHAFNQYVALENLDSANNLTLSEIDDYIEGGLNQLKWPVTAPAITTTRDNLALSFDGKIFTCDHPEGI